MIGKCYHNSEAYSDKLNVSIHYRSKCSNEESKIFGIVYPILFYLIGNCIYTVSYTQGN